MTSSCPLGPSLACSAVGQYWMNSKTWIAGPTHTALNVTKHWHYLRHYGGMTIGTHTKGPGRAYGCRYNRAALEVRGYAPITALLNSASSTCCYLILSFWCSARFICLLGVLTLSACWWMEPEWWRSWTEEMARPAGSLCWYHGCPSVSGNAGAGLGLPGRAVRCSAARKGKEECTRLWICRL